MTIKSTTHLLLVCSTLFFAFSCNNHSVSEDALSNEQINDMVIANRNMDSLYVLLQKFETQNNLYGQVITYRELGKRYRESAKFDTAINMHEKGLEVAQKLDDKVQIVQLLNQQGTNYRRIGLLHKASDFHYEALEMAEQLDKSDITVLKSRSAALNGIGNIQSTLKNLDEALRIFRIALQGEKEAENKLGQGINYANIGAIFEEKQMNDSAFYYYQLSMDKNQEIKSKLGISLCYNHLGRILEKNGEYQRAVSNYENAYRIMEKSDDKWHWLESCIALGKVNFAINNFQNAKLYLSKGLKIALDINSIEHLSILYELLYQYDLKQKDFRGALNNFVQSKIFTDSVVNKDNMTYIQNLRMNFEEEKNVRELAEKQAIIERQNLQRMVLFVVVLFSVLVLLLLWYLLHLRRKRNSELEAMNATKDKFFTIISHDLKNPAIAQRNALQMLLNHEGVLDKDSLKTYYLELLKSADAQVELLYNLLNWAQVQTERMPFKPAIFDLNLVVAQETTLVKSLIDNKNITLESDLPEIAEMCADKTMLATVIRNLLTNAIKFTNEGGKIKIACHCGNDGVVVAISDSGIGMNAETLKNLFHLDTQTSRTGTAGEQGSGLGLIVCKELVERHGGTISVESEEGKGSRFEFRIRN